MYNCVIVDDEELARTRLRKLLSKHSRKIKITKEFSEAGSLIEFLRKTSIDFIFLDIEMPGMKGIDALKLIPESVRVVFTTAYQSFAVDAFEFDAFDYLLKPISQERLDKSIIKLLSNTKMDKPETVNEAADQEITQFPVSTKTGVQFLELNEIAYFEADAKYVTLHTVNGTTHLLSYTLSDLEVKLRHFMRIQKGLLINSSLIKEIKPYFNSRFKILLRDKVKSELISGRSYSKSIQVLLKI